MRIVKGPTGVLILIVIVTVYDDFGRYAVPVGGNLLRNLQLLELFFELSDFILRLLLLFLCLLFFVFSRVTCVILAGFFHTKDSFGHKVLDVLNIFEKPPFLLIFPLSAGNEDIVVSAETTGSVVANLY